MPACGILTMNDHNPTQPLELVKDMSPTYVNFVRFENCHCPKSLSITENHAKQSKNTTKEHCKSCKMKKKTNLETSRANAQPNMYTHRPLY